MKTAGIIAEYNPFHNGHQFHMEETRRLTGADYIVVALSGSFVQRGAPALLNKYDRARLALLGGADLVFELPVTSALQSAEGFATGGICLLSGLGVVDEVSCGCELAGSDPDSFSQVVKLLLDEPPAYKKHLASDLTKGMSFPKARESAVTACLGEDAARLLSGPNDILALEYAKAIQKSDSDMHLTLIPRRGSSHESGSISDGYSSATAIRNLLLTSDAANISDLLRPNVPEESYTFLMESFREHRCLGEHDFSDLLFYALTKSRAQLNDFGPANSDLAGRTANQLEHFTGWTEFAALLKTRNRTYTAISRYLTHILLGIRREDLALAAKYHGAPYARLLGLRKEASPVLKAIRQNADIPILTRPAHDRQTLNKTQSRLFELDLQASEIYRQLLQSRSGYEIKSELRQPLITI
ncbi:MAG: nucleotidyltransferase family protein [Lachnospiraceae bacterium]|nr:nucleotidyltransferase family protein [Lachnospiraceae bacterium]